MFVTIYSNFGQPIASLHVGVQ